MIGILDGVKDRSFLSFTFDGEAIENFGFAVVYNGDRLSSVLQPNFSNTTSTIPGRTGTLYWGTDITGYNLTVNVATDRATSRQIANLKGHFRPGKYGRLVFEESKYCYCYAIVDSPSDFTFVPFEEEVTINGHVYTDTIYKGEGTINFFIPQTYFYFNIGYDSFGDEYKNEPWFLASGLPLITSIREENCYLSNGVIANKVANNSPRVYAYNAGNAPAAVNLKFTYTQTFAAGNTVPWRDIQINKVIITKPRLFRDIDYALQLLDSHSSNWNTEAKVTTLNNLRDNLDSGLRAELIGIVNATGAGLKWATPSAAMTEIRNLINGVPYKISIDAVEMQSIMQVELTLHNFNSSSIPTYTEKLVENIGDSTNGEYLFIEGSQGLDELGKVHPQEIRMSQLLTDLEVFFTNTYLV